MHCNFIAQKVNKSKICYAYSTEYVLTLFYDKDDSLANKCLFSLKRETNTANMCSGKVDAAKKCNIYSWKLPYGQLSAAK